MTVEDRRLINTALRDIDYWRRCCRQSDRCVVILFVVLLSVFALFVPVCWVLYASSRRGPCGF